MKTKKEVRHKHTFFLLMFILMYVVFIAYAIYADNTIGGLKEDKQRLGEALCDAAFGVKSDFEYIDGSYVQCFDASTVFTETYTTKRTP